MSTETKGTGGEKVAFLLTFFAMFVVVVFFLATMDALPESVEAQTATVIEETAPLAAVAPTQPEEPVRIVAKAVGVDTPVANPSSADVDVLDAALLKGAVRYPSSALLGQEGTVVLLGHSTTLPIVRNQAYKAFNDVQKLVEGEVISVYSGSIEYRYAVTGVQLADIDTDTVALESEGKHLVLVTCDLRDKSKKARFIVEADFVGAYQSQ